MGGHLFFYFFFGFSSQPLSKMFFFLWGGFLEDLEKMEKKMMRNTFVYLFRLALALACMFRFLTKKEVNRTNARNHHLSCDQINLEEGRKKKEYDDDDENYHLYCVPIGIAFVCPIYEKRINHDARNSNLL